ncbi:MAG: hypothetical protein J6J23_06680, partial [Clostridia bacterium]|nr:hypothetical protein [Clostridia bacterium]
RTEKTDKVTGKKSMVRRPYFICYNETLKCNVLYVMTGSRTLEQIKKKQYYDSIITPECIYDFVDSSLTDGHLDQGTHTKSNISTISLTRALPIPNEVFDEIQQSGIVDWANGDFDSRQVPVLRDFMSHFYNRAEESYITSATRSGRAQEWFLDKEDSGSWQRLSRPSAIYTAMFINYALSELENPKATDPLKLKQLKSMVEGATSAYLEYLRFLNTLDGYRRRHPKIYRAYFEAKYDIASTFRSKRYEDAYRDVMGALVCQEGVEANVRNLLSLERAIDKNLSVAVNASISYFSGLSTRINISSVPMNESLFNSLSKIAEAFADNKYKALLSSWNEKTNARFDDKIAQIESQIYLERIAREQDEYRKRIAKARELELITSRTERVKNAVITALALYEQFYSEPFSRLIKGKLYEEDIKVEASNFVKLFTTYSDGTNLNLKRILRDGDDRDAQRYLADRIMAMSEFTEVMESSRITIEGSDKARKMQAYAKSRSNRIGGNEGEAVERAIELMTLIHEELSRTENLKHTSTDKSPVETIIEKVLKDKERYAIVDFSSGTSARAYFDEMLLVHQTQANIENISNILTMRVEALWTMQDLKKDYEELLEAYDKVCQALTGMYSEVIKKALSKPTLEEYLTDCENQIMELLKNGQIDASATIKEIQSMRRREISQITKEKQALLDFIEIYKKSTMEYSEYVTRFKEDEANIAKMVLSAKTEVGFAPNEGVSEGLLEGTVGRVTRDLDTGEETFEEEQEKHEITDEHVMLQIFSRTIPSPDEVERQTKNSISQDTNIFQVIEDLKTLERNTKAWEANLHTSYDAVRNLYIEMLHYRKKFKEVGERVLNAQRLFAENFEPRSRYDGSLLFDEEVTEQIRSTLIDEVENGAPDVQQYFDAILPFKFITSVINYFNEIEVRMDITQPADDYVNLERITKEINANYLYIDGEDNLINLLNAYEKNAIALADAVEYARFYDVMAMTEARELYYRMMPTLEYEFMLETLKIASRVQLVTTAEEAESEKCRRNEIITLNKIIGDYVDTDERLYYMTHGLYPHLIKRLPSFEVYVQNCFDRMVQQLNPGLASNAFGMASLRFSRMEYEASKGHATLNERTGAVNAFKLYHVWLTRLHNNDRIRKKYGLEVITEGRDLARENQILCCDTTPFGVDIEITNEDD